MYLQRKAALLAAGAVLLSGSAVWAQTDPVMTRGDVLGDIIVTAQRRAERLQDVPIAITALTSQDLETKQINNTLDIVNYVPNLIGHNNTALGTANTYSLRGLANTESISTFDPPIGTYIDDIYIARQGANNFSLFDIERIEVLRGPQGTLFGRNTTGGAINVILRKPGDTVSGYAEAGYGRYNRAQARASVDLPITPKLLTKISGYYIHSDGYVHDRVTGQKLNGEESWGARGALRALPADNVTWDLSADYLYSSVSNLVNFRDVDGGQRFNLIPFRKGEGLGTDFVSDGLADIGLGNTARSFILSSNLEVELNDTTSINLITGYYYLRQKYMTDSFGGLSSGTAVFDLPNILFGERGLSTPLVNDSWTKQFSQEVKVTGSLFDNKVSYVGGFYFSSERNWTNFANLVFIPNGPRTVNADRLMRNNTDSLAGYFQTDLHLTSRLTFTAGIRYTDERKNIFYTPNDNPLPRANTINQPFDTLDVLAQGIPTKLQAKVWTPRFAVNYKLTPDFMAFASVTKGFKSGGWNSRAYDPGNSQAFTQETIWSYEGGVRSEWFDHMLKVNLTGFYFKDTDAQLPGGGLNPLTGTITYLTRNVADMTNYGLEGEVVFAPTTKLNLFWNFGLQHAKFKNINQNIVDQINNCLAGIYANNCDTGVVTRDGRVGEPTRAPRFTSTLGGSYTFDLGHGYALRPSVNWNYISKTWVSTSNNPMGLQPGHGLINAGLALQAEQGWTLRVSCDNCLNKTYESSYLIFPYLSDPGRWMVSASYKF